MTNLEKAREMLLAKTYGNCVLYGDEIIHTSKKQGIAPMLEFLSAGLDMKGFSAADTVAGKALALLMVYAGVSEVYADVMSRGAVEIFERFEVRHVYSELTEQINNRAGDAICPMELAVMNTWEPEEAYKILSDKTQKP